MTGYDVRERPENTPGSCPHCGTALARADVLVEYDAADETRLFAECLECDDVVHPA